MLFFFVHTIIHSKKLDFFKSYFLFRFSSLFCALKFLSIFSFRFLSLFFFMKVFKHLFIEILSLFFSWMFLSIFLMLRFSSLSFSEVFKPISFLEVYQFLQTSVKEKAWNLRNLIKKSLEKINIKKCLNPTERKGLKNLSKKNTWKLQWKK